MRHILVVEDHADSRRTLAKLLQSSGFKVIEADGYWSAMAAAEAHPCDLLISDIGLPDGDGCDLFAALRARPGGSRLAGLVVTGYDSPGDIERCLQAGFAARLLKPIHFEKLTKAISEALAG